MHQRFERVAELGPEVFRARDRIEGRTVVVKTGRDRAVLAREAELLLTLDHPSLRDVVAFDGATLALEHVEGDSLDRAIAEHPELASRLARDLLRLLVHLHEAGIAHGDLKPGNAIVDRRGRVRLIDLGLAGAIGTAPYGGSRGFLAAEYERGAPLSSSGDLYALGKTFEPLLDAMAPRARQAISRCLLEGDARPSSAAAVLVEMGETARPLDRSGRVRFEPTHLLSDLEDELARSRLVAVIAPIGAGRNRLARELRRRALRRGQSAVVLGPESELAAIDRVEIAIATVAIAGDPRIGRTIVLARDRDEVPRHAHTFDVPPLDRSRVEAVLVATGVRATSAYVESLATASGGLAGIVVRAAELASETSARTGADATRHVASVRGAELRAAEPRSLERARELVRDAELEAAISVLEALEPTDEVKALLATATAGAGRLGAAIELVEGLGSRADPSLRLEAVRWLERLGRYDDAITLARELAGTDRAADAALAGAMASLARGRIDDASRLVASGLDAGPPAETAVKLHLVGSDIALRRGESAEAIRLASKTLELAVDPAPQLRAEIESRLASAHSLSGRMSVAREHHARALAAMREVGDGPGLVPYVVNLATAEHATARYADAIALYEEGIRLSTRFDREALRAVALVNLSSLLVSIGAAVDAEPLLADARATSQKVGSAVYAAQATLIEAEAIGIGDPRQGRVVAERAREEFLAAGAIRQALEAELLVHELGSSRAEHERALAFAADRRSRLVEAGLVGRLELLVARAALALDRLKDARPAALEAERVAEAERDALLVIRAAKVAALVDERLGAGGERAIDRAREAAARVLVDLGADLRDRFARDPRYALPELRRGDEASVEHGLGAAGRRIVSLVRRVLLHEDERAVLNTALEEAIELTRAERAFLVQRSRGAQEVVVAKNLDGDAIRKRKRSFSRSVADRVIETGEPVLTAAATDDPELGQARSIIDLGVRSILCVPIRAPSGVTGALYLDHRFERGRFTDASLDVVQALADVIGLALENARLHRDARARQEELERAHAIVSQENLRRGAELERLEQRLERLEPHEAGEIAGRSPALRSALTVAKRIASSNLTVLVEGESGTGKELFARYVHEQSLRSQRAFLAINCAALTETLLESELFGHVRGAFTGAMREHPGLFRAADGGTLLLDEIGEMPMRMQTRLLRVLQEGEVRPVGAKDEIRVDVRVIAATNRDLEREVEGGRFRRDLFFRIAGARIRLPPLRERLDDLPELVERLLDRIAQEPGSRRLVVSRAAFAVLMRHGWPGNVRELEQTLRRAVLVAEGEAIEPHDLAIETDVASRSEAIRGFDRDLLTRTLRAANGNRSKAARALGVSRMTLYRWLRRYEL